MYCPNCAAPIEGVKFCRGCGTNVSLVPQAVSGRFAELPAESERHGKPKRAATFERAASSFFTGIGFVLVAVAIAFFQRGGAGWWFWMLIPGFACIGSGVGQYLRVRSEQQHPGLHAGSYVTPSQIAPVGAPQIGVPDATTTSNLKSGLPQQGSVTEDTTRHLE
ncbi:MAG: zinc ribbon domain-containing protein [Acidobacteriota bacterium]